MITGTVKAEAGKDGLTYLKPQITISIANTSRIFVNLDAIVDTGFTGWLTLPGDTIEELGLTRYGQRPANQASGIGIFTIYGALVSWHGGHRPILVHQTSGEPLAGMALLEGSQLIVEASDGVVVIIKEMLLRISCHKRSEIQSRVNFCGSTSTESPRTSGFRRWTFDACNPREGYRLMWEAARATIAAVAA